MQVLAGWLQLLADYLGLLGVPESSRMSLALAGAYLLVTVGVGALGLWIVSRGRRWRRNAGVAGREDGSE